MHPWSTADETSLALEDYFCDQKFHCDDNQKSMPCLFLGDGILPSSQLYNLCRFPPSQNNARATANNSKGQNTA
jgi:hypothetical protein